MDPKKLECLQNGGFGGINTLSDVLTINMN